jgi:hypothetical protein
MRKILKFKTKFKQLGEGCCGPNALKHIFINKYGLDVPEKRLIDISNCAQRNGASVRGILKVADTFNLNYKIKHNSSIQDLIDSVINDNPGILLVQAWPNNKVSDWSNINYSGHYIDFFGFDTLEEKIFYYDPFDGKKKNISYKKLEEVWHDEDPKNKIFYNKFAIFFK